MSKQASIAPDFKLERDVFTVARCIKSFTYLFTVFRGIKSLTDWILDSGYSYKLQDDS